jgi:DNA-directed RNA polymerase subunit RPC12/RpoP
MTDKCASCGKPIDTIFLEKISGTYLKNKKGKKRAVCSACQRTLSIAELRQKI